ncbi:MAG: TonB-dependent receptor [Verrucomicrobiota bacterium]
MEYQRTCSPLRVMGVMLLMLAFTLLTARAQDGGAVSGVVVNSYDGVSLSGATVTVRGTTLATQTDGAGRFELKGLPPGDQVLRFSKSGFAAAVVTDVRVIVGQTTTVNGNLRPEFYEMEEYEVTAEEFAQQTEQILIERQESGAMVDALGSEQFSKLGAGDAGAIVARVTGVSVVGGKYAVVRGLSDRYTRTLMNGVEVPSADPYKLSPQLDLFPSAMIDRISVSKTFTPDQPGGTGGGTIDIVTKSFPEKPFVKAAVGTSYNPNSNLRNDFLAAPESSMNMVAVPSGPKMIGENVFGLTTVPTQPGPATTRETVATANTRRQQANAVAGLLQELGTANFAGVQRETPLNSSIVVSAGKATSLWGQKLGVFGGANYKREFLGQSETQIGRYSESGVAESLGARQQGNIKTDYGANFNLGFEPWEHSLLGFNFMLAHSTDEEARHDDYYYNLTDPTRTLQKWQVHHTERQILNYQLNGQHELPVLLDSKLDWVVALANTTQEEPDQRFMNYYMQGGQPTFGDAGLPFPQYPSRYFREIQEDGINYRADWTLPLDFLPEEAKIKTGYFGSSNEREFKEQYFTYNLSSGFDPNNPNTYLNNPAYLQYTTTYLGNSINGVGRTNYNFARYVTETYAHPYTASLDVNAVYLMADVGLLPWLRFIGGARLEKTLLDVNAPRDGTAHIDQTDVLPAASLVITFVTNVNLRLSYGETVSRPSYREIAPVQSYLPDLDLVAQGNPNLEMIAITSYDLRIEWFPAPGDVLSAGVFYKQLDRPIELISLSAGDDLVTWINRDNAPADLMGIELEARKSMEFLSSQLRGLSLGVNVSLIESSTKLTETELLNKREVDPFASDTRPLYDQSPYIINLDLTYDHPTSGTSLSVGANLTGPRIVLTKTRGPDLYEHPPITLDAAVSQKFWQQWTVRAGVKNILDGEYRKTYGEEYEGNIYEGYRRGRTYSLSLTVEF